ncbi:XRE family transcriptional regulator [Roseibium denhamense]|uniref:Helix-turn-helix domain-containing protein n=1 Tax=Roseibium denhamense TaxID=76305 RepID=A0ABY1NW93_9HYPH|nr:helix-turn-helix transcriptional regulator [Roseibium denhamense]MTI04434.1 XRE family transcriptional regulator [Roseibium denhamense]SMP19657.1 Helix-turn-helix domain-containing protein [Roseibium denhamense]
MSGSPIVLAQNIGPSLRRWRLMNRIKQDALASDLHVSQAKISRWETGQSIPSAKEATRIAKLLHARPETAADRALADLVRQSTLAVHLVCDQTHALLAASRVRLSEWHAPENELIGKPLWRFASEGIRANELRLAEHGWFEPASQDVVFETERAEFAEMTIPESRIRISRMPLSDGSFARLVRDDLDQQVANRDRIATRS